MPRMMPSFLALAVGLTTQLSWATSLEAQDKFLEDFKNPPNSFRPKFRYWLPDASVPHESVIQDIEAIAAVGAGGLEFLPFYNYGFGPTTDWSVYGFAQPAFKDIFAAALEAAAAHDLVFDFALGANQAQGVPADIETPGLGKELVYGAQAVRAGETFSGPAPPPDIDFNRLSGFMHDPELWGSNKLLAVVAARVVREEPLVFQFYSRTLDEASLVDLTNLTSGADGELTWTAPAVAGGGNSTWLVFGFYERYTNQRSCDAGLNATDALTNGSWVTDHFSAAGATKTTDFWDENMLSDERIGSLVREAANLAWEDSMELQSALPWTPGFLDRFEKVNGYSAVKYLPLFFHASNAWHGYLPPYNYTNVLDTYTTDGGKYVQDYRLALGDGYAEYLKHFKDWAQGLGISYSNQPAYNMPLDMTKSIPQVPVPELESLGFNESINAYRHFTGAAHLQQPPQTNLISTEVGAVNTGAYTQRVPELRRLLDGSFAAGVNVLVLHGYAYSGAYVDTTPWPGYTTFQFDFSEMWGPRQPAWGHLDDTLLYAARHSLVLRTGVPRVDFAVCAYENPSLYGANALPEGGFNQLGYTFEYLGPKNLISEQAVVRDGILAPDGPAFKALVLYNQTQISPAASAALVDFAAAGLPIYIVGTTPNTTIGTQGQGAVSANMGKLQGFDNVHVLGDFSADTLADNGITARASVQQPQTDVNATGLYTFWRSDAESGLELVYLLNQGPSGKFTVSFDVTGPSTPYFLDAWTGERTPILAYERDISSGVITVDVGLKQDQTKIIAFASGQSSTRLHVASHSDNIIDTRISEAGDLEVLLSDVSNASLILGNGTAITIPSEQIPLPQPITISPWNLTVESHGPSTNNDTLDGSITTMAIGLLETLAPWTQIPGLEQVSGVGTYTATFSLPDNLQDAAAVTLIDFAPVLNTLRAWINGHLVRPVDPTDPVVDVTELLAPGQNEIRIEVTSTLFNAVKANLDSIRSQGAGPNTPSLYTDADWQEFGLIGPVEVRMLRRVVIS